jgi:hypothetical protein
MSCPSHPPWLDHSNTIWWGLQVMKLLSSTLQLLLSYTHTEMNTSHENCIHNSGSGTCKGANSNIVGRGTMLQAGRSWVKFPMRSLDFSIDLILPAPLWLSGQLSLQQTWVPRIFLGVKGDRRGRLMTSPPSVSWFSRDCRSLYFSQPYGPPQPVTGIGKRKKWSIQNLYIIKSH